MDSVCSGGSCRTTRPGSHLENFRISTAGDYGLDAGGMRGAWEDSDLEMETDEAREKDEGGEECLVDDEVRVTILSYIFPLTSCRTRRGPLSSSFARSSDGRQHGRQRGT